MKKLIAILLLVSTVYVFGQSPSVVEQLTKLYTENAVLDDKELSFDKETHIMKLSGYQIGVNSNTHVKAESLKANKKIYAVNFYCQKGTFITHKDTPEEKHASLSIELKNKKASKEFVRLFTALISQ